MSFTPEQLAEGLAEAERRGDTATADAFRRRMGTGQPSGSTDSTGARFPNVDAWIQKSRDRFKPKAK